MFFVLFLVVAPLFTLYAIEKKMEFWVYVSCMSVLVFVAIFFD
mgnify:FL=1